MGHNRVDTFRALTLLHHLAQQGPLPPAEISYLLDQLAEIVDTAHHAGRQIGGQLRPEQILMLPNGRIGLLPLPNGEPPTAAVSPEEVRGETTTAATDRWLLGALVYEMLTGRAPFIALRPATLLQQIAEEDPEPLQGEAACVQDVLDRALAKWPANRHHSAQDLANAFWSALPHPEADGEATTESSMEVPTPTGIYLHLAAGRPLRLNDHRAPEIASGRRRKPLRWRLPHLLARRRVIAPSPFGVGQGEQSSAG